MHVGVIEVALRGNTNDATRTVGRFIHADENVTGGVAGGARPFAIAMMSSASSLFPPEVQLY
jgi:hypothetical protein